MATCPKCGAAASFQAKFCQNCGAALPDVPVEQTEPAPYTPVSYPRDDSYQPQEYQPQQYQPYYNQPVTPVSTGGLLAWAIITLFLCTIPGIVAIVKTTSINKATTVEEQAARMSSAKTWCIIGTVLGVLALFGSIIAGNMY